MSRMLYHLSYTAIYKKLRGVDLNHRPSGYEPDELPDCSTPRQYFLTFSLYCMPEAGIEPARVLPPTGF